MHTVHRAQQAAERRAIALRRFASLPFLRIAFLKCATFFSLVRSFRFVDICFSSPEKKLILCLLRRYRMGAASLQFDSLIERDTSFSCHSIDFKINKNATDFNWSGNDSAILSRWTLISNLIECNRLQNVLKNMFELRSGKCLSWLVSD